MPIQTRTPKLHLQTTATAKLTRAYLQKLDRQNYLATASALLIIGFSLFWLLFHLGGWQNTIVFSDSMYSVAAWIGSFWVCITAYRARYGPLRLEPRHQLAWLLIGIGLFTYGTGGAYYTYLELRTLNPVPSLADIGFTLFYIFTFVGLLLMPTKPRSARFRIRIALDALITTLCILGISWYFVISPIFISVKDIPKLIVAASYPFWDILLILAIVLLIYQRTERILYSSLFLCGTGVLSQICADSGYAYTIPLNTYTTGTVYIDPFWFTGVLLIGLSALYQYAKIARRVYRESIQSTSEVKAADYVTPDRKGKLRSRLILLQSFLIYIPLTVLLTLMLYSEITHDNHRSFFLVLLTAMVGILVTIRYVLATNENEVLLREREQRRAEAERLRLLTARLTEVLELDPLLTRIVSLARSELHFDAALLLLIEDYNRPLDFQASLLVRAATSLSAETTTWRIQGERLPYGSVLLGKEIDVFWPEQTIDVPADIYAWQQEQQIRSTLFVPLIYQGKILGSLGFSSRTLNHFSEHDSYIANAFAEQAATALEHAHLYQTAREHELFAKALANIAARLNSAVVHSTEVGAEIHQLICTEGAHALQADYALLYVSNKNRQLVPLATFTNEQESPTAVHDWPPIYQRDHEIQALNSLQPILVQIDPLTQSGRLPAVSITSSSPSIPAVQPARTTTPGLRGRGTRASSLREALFRRYVNTAIFAPLIAGDQPVAMLVLARSFRAGTLSGGPRELGGGGWRGGQVTQQKKPFASIDLPQAQDFAEQAAIAFTNAQLYSQLRTAHQQLQELDQLKDQFMVTASHELRTPLTAVQGYLELLAEYSEALPPEQQQEFLQKARRGCDELVLLLSNVMDASRLEIEAGIRPAHLERVPIYDLIESVIELIEPQLTQQNREVFVHIPKQLSVQADPGRLRQVLLNLSVNALKYSPEATPIAFSARTIFDHVPSVIISVTDKGKGIKLEDQAQLFQRFARLEDDLNSTVRGSGLGLYISRRLIEAMHGKIWIESSGIANAGSTLHIQLPLA